MKEARHKPTNTNHLQYSLGDIIDRLTILTRKVFRGEEDAYKELEYLREGLNKEGYLGDIILACLRLAHQNWAIWDLENDIRKAGNPIQRFGLEEIGRRAMRIRDYNKKRIQYKNDLNQLSKNSFKEFKIEHRSQ